MKKILLSIAIPFLVFFAVLVAPTSAEPAKIVIGISQFVQHPSIDAIRRGIIDFLSKNGYEEGRTVTYDLNIAGGDFTRNTEIAERLAATDPDLIITLTTPSAQAMVGATGTIPILFAAVIDPVGAGLTGDLKASGTNVTGTIFISPVREQFELFRKIMPGLKRMGFVYNPREENAVVSLGQARVAGSALGIEIVEATAADPSEVSSAAETLIGRVDAVYVPIDNTVASAFDELFRVCTDNKIPLFATAVELVERGAIAAVSVDFYKVGTRTGARAVEILEGKDPGKMPVETVDDLLTYINVDTAERVGLAIPETVIRKADKVIGTLR